MKHLTAPNPETRSADIVPENLEHPKVLFPEAFTEDLPAYDRKKGVELRHLPLIFPACVLSRHAARTRTAPPRSNSSTKENAHELRRA